ncbi:MAG: hypothetical protein AAGI30_05775 [Planctomycetota bacterium]
MTTTTRFSINTAHGRGAALVISLALVLFLTALALPFLITTQSDSQVADETTQQIEQSTATQQAVDFISGEIGRGMQEYVSAYEDLRVELSNGTGNLTTENFRALLPLYRTRADEVNVWLSSSEPIPGPVACLPLGLDSDPSPAFVGTGQVPHTLEGDYGPRVTRPDESDPPDALLRYEYLFGRAAWRDPGDPDYDAGDPSTWATLAAPTTFEEWNTEIWPQLTKLGPYVTPEDPFFDLTILGLTDDVGDDALEQQAFQGRWAIGLDGFQGASGVEAGVQRLHEWFQSNRYVHLPFPLANPQQVADSVGESVSDLETTFLVDSPCQLILNDRDFIADWNAEMNLLRQSFIERRFTADRGYFEYIPDDPAVQFSDIIREGDYREFQPDTPPYRRYYDRRWQRLPIVTGDGTVWIAAIRIRDTSGMVNINTATQGTDIENPANHAFGDTPADIDAYGLLGLDRTVAGGGIHDAQVLNPVAQATLGLSGSLSPPGVLPTSDFLSRGRMWRFPDNSFVTENISEQTLTQLEQVLGNDEGVWLDLGTYGYSTTSDPQGIVGFDSTGTPFGFDYRRTDVAGSRSALYTLFGSGLARLYGATDFRRWHWLADGDPDTRLDISAINPRPYGTPDEAFLRGLSREGAALTVALDGDGPERAPGEPGESEYRLQIATNPGSTTVDSWLRFDDDGNQSGLYDAFNPRNNPRPLDSPFALNAHRGLLDPTNPSFSQAAPRSIAVEPVTEHLTTWNSMRYVPVFDPLGYDGVFANNDATDPGNYQRSGDTAPESDFFDATGRTQVAWRAMMPPWLDALDGRLGMPLPREAAVPDANGASWTAAVAGSGQFGRDWVIPDPSDTTSFVSDENGLALFEGYFGGGFGATDPITNRVHNPIPYYRLDPNRLSAAELHDVLLTVFTPGLLMPDDFFPTPQISSPTNVGVLDYQGLVKDVTRTIPWTVVENWYRNFTRLEDVPAQANRGPIGSATQAYPAPGTPAAPINSGSAPAYGDAEGNGDVNLFDFIAMSSNAAAAMAANIVALRDADGYARADINASNDFVIRVNRDDTQYEPQTNGQFNPNLPNTEYYTPATFEEPANPRSNVALTYGALQGSGFDFVRPDNNDANDGAAELDKLGTTPTDGGYEHVGLEPQPFITEVVTAVATKIVDSIADTDGDASFFDDGTVYFIAVELHNPFTVPVSLRHMALRIGDQHGDHDQNGDGLPEGTGVDTGDGRGLIFPLQGVGVRTDALAQTDYQDSRDAVIPPGESVVVYIDTSLQREVDPADPVANLRLPPRNPDYNPLLFEEADVNDLLTVVESRNRLFPLDTEAANVLNPNVVRSNTNDPDGVGSLYEDTDVSDFLEELRPRAVGVGGANVAEVQGAGLPWIFNAVRRYDRDPNTDTVPLDGLFERAALYTGPGTIYGNGYQRNQIDTPFGLWLQAISDVEDPSYPYSFDRPGRDIEAFTTNAVDGERCERCQIEAGRRRFALPIRSGDLPRLEQMMNSTGTSSDDTVELIVIDDPNMRGNAADNGNFSSVRPESAARNPMVIDRLAYDSNGNGLGEQWFAEAFNPEAEPITFAITVIGQIAFEEDFIGIRDGINNDSMLDSIDRDRSDPNPNDSSIDLTSPTGPVYTDPSVDYIFNPTGALDGEADLPPDNSEEMGFRTADNFTGFIITSTSLQRDKRQPTLDDPDDLIDDAASHGIYELSQQTGRLDVSRSGRNDAQRGFVLYLREGAPDYLSVFPWHENQAGSADPHPEIGDIDGSGTGGEFADYVLAKARSIISRNDRLTDVDSPRDPGTGEVDNTSFTNGNFDLATETYAESGWDIPVLPDSRVSQIGDRRGLIRPVAGNLFRTDTPDTARVTGPGGFGVTPPPTQLPARNAPFTRIGQLALAPTVSHRLNLRTDRWETFSEQMATLMRAEGRQVQRVVSDELFEIDNDDAGFGFVAHPFVGNIQGEIVGGDTPFDPLVDDSIATAIESQAGNALIIRPGYALTELPFDIAELDPAVDPIINDNELPPLRRESVNMLRRAGLELEEYFALTRSARALEETGGFFGSWDDIRHAAAHEYATRLGRVGRLDFTRWTADFGGFATQPRLDGSPLDIGQDSSLNLPVAMFIFDVFDLVSYRNDLSSDGNIRPEIPMAHGKLNINTASTVAMSALPGLAHFNDPYPGVQGYERTNRSERAINPAVGITAYREMIADPIVQQWHSAALGARLGIPFAPSLARTLAGTYQNLQHSHYDFRLRSLGTGITNIRGIREVVPGVQIDLDAPFGPGVAIDPDTFTPIPAMERDPRQLRGLLDFPNAPLTTTFDGGYDQSPVSMAPSAQFEDARISQVRGFASIGELLAVRNTQEPGFGLDVLATDFESTTELGVTYDDEGAQYFPEPALLTTEPQIIRTRNEPSDLQGLAGIPERGTRFIVGPCGTTDCNNDGFPDAIDCDGDDLPDQFYDCNGDGIFERNLDTDADGIPDRTDCNGDGVAEFFLDCNRNGVIDPAEQNLDTDGDNLNDRTDCNGDGIPDIRLDCNNDYIPDNGNFIDFDDDLTGDAIAAPTIAQPRIDPTPDDVPDDYEEQVMLFDRIANLVDIRSDSFLAEIELVGLRFDVDAARDLPDENEDDPTDVDGVPTPDNPFDIGVDIDGRVETDGNGRDVLTIDGRWVPIVRRRITAILDRSNVWSEADRPRVIFFTDEELPAELPSIRD